MKLYIKKIIGYFWGVTLVDQFMYRDQISATVTKGLLPNSGNDAKTLLTKFCIWIKILLLLPKDYFLIPSKCTKNLLTKIELVCS